MDDAARGARDIRRLVVVSSLAFSALLTALAWGLARLRDATLASYFAGSHPVEIAVGAGIGALAGGCCLLLVARLPSLAGLRRLASEAVAGIEPRWSHLLLVSASAGWGEEVFFRGALQPIAGIWLTSLAFVLLHGVLRHRSRGGLAFAVFLFAASAGLGFLAAGMGLLCAISAHAAYDLTVLAGIRGGMLAANVPDTAPPGQDQSLTD